MSTLPQRLAGILPEISTASSRLLASTRDAYNGTKGVPGGFSPTRTLHAEGVEKVFREIADHFDQHEDEYY